MLYGKPLLVAVFFLYKIQKNENCRSDTDMLSSRRQKDIVSMMKNHRRDLNF